VANDRPPPPDFFVIGAYRSGTTSLYRYLDQHPEVFVPPIKEPNFFAVDGNPAASAMLRRQSIGDRSEYDGLFRGAQPGQRRGDVSPEYLANPHAPGRIASEFGTAPFVAILRNPIDRAWSDYLLHRRDGNEPLESFQAALADQERRQRGADDPAGHYIDTGMYAQQLRRWFDHVDRARVLVLLHDDVIADRQAAMARIFAHIGVDPTFVVAEEDAVNASGVPTNPLVAFALKQRAVLRPLVSKRLTEKVRPAWERFLSRNLTKPALTRDDRRVLAEIYRDEITDLGELLDRDVAHWLHLDEDHLVARADGGAEGAA
jgi:hypothetical protein